MPGAPSGLGALGPSRLESHPKSQWLLALQEVGQPRPKGDARGSWT